MSQNELHPNEAEKLIADRIKVTPEDVARCRTAILDAVPQYAAMGKISSNHLIEDILKATGAIVTTRVITHSSAGPMTAIDAVAKYLSWRLAAAEAILSLVHDGTLLPMSAPMVLKTIVVSYSTAPPNSGGQHGQWEFDQVAVCVPGAVRLAPSRATS
jgi:hypothetical protein